MKVGKAWAALKVPPSKTGSIFAAFYLSLTFVVKLIGMLEG